MKCYWLDVRRAHIGAVTIAALLMLLIAVGDVAVPMLSLTAMADYALPVSLVSPIALALVLAWALARGDERLEGVAVRPLGTADAGLALAMAGAFGSLGLILDALGVAALGVEAARSAIGLVGLMLVGRWVGGSGVAGVVPVGYVLLVGFFGGETPRTAEWWAWLVRPPGSTSAAVQAVGLFVAGPVMTSVGRREPPALR